MKRDVLRRSGRPKSPPLDPEHGRLMHTTPKEDVALSAYYTAEVWRWSKLPCAEWVTPKTARGFFGLVNFYAGLYRVLNPRKFSLRHQLLHRHAVIDRMLRDAGCGRVVEIAAGFSPRGCAMSATPSVDYVEIDLAPMVAAKRAQLASTIPGQAALARDNFSLVAGDVLTLDLAEHGTDRRTAVVTEGLMMYLSREQQLDLWRRVVQHLRATGGVYVFDYIPLSDEPRRSALGRALSRLRIRAGGAPSAYTYDERTREDVADDLRAAGFAHVEIVATDDVARRWDLPRARARTHALVYRCTAPVASTITYVPSVPAAAPVSLTTAA